MGILKKIGFFKKSKTNVKPFTTGEDGDDLQSGQETEPISPGPTRASIAPPPVASPMEGSSPSRPRMRLLTGSSRKAQASQHAEAKHPALPPRGGQHAFFSSTQEDDDDSVVQISPRPAVSSAAAPKAIALEDGDVDEPGVDASLEELKAAVIDAFGEAIATSLQSSKWDKRAQALKAVGALLKGLDIQAMAKPGSTGVLGKGAQPRERLKRWRAACLLLSHYMKDKVMPVRLAALDLFVDTFSNADGVAPRAEIRRVLTDLLEGLIDGLGDSNLRLHESARKCVLFTAEGRSLLGLGSVLARLKVRLTSWQQSGRSTERTKVYFGVLDTVNTLLRHFPGRRAGDIEDEDVDAPHSSEDSWTQHCISPFIVAGMDESLGLRVRGSAVALAVTVYSTLGGEAMVPILAELRPAKQAFLKQKFQESEEEDQGGDSGSEAGDGDGEHGQLPEGRPRADLRNLVVCGVAVKGIPAMPTRRMPDLPGSLNEDYDEENFMDGILEDAGAVFSSTGMMMHDLAAAAHREQMAMIAAGRRGVQGFSDTGYHENFGLSTVGISTMGVSHHLAELAALEQEHWMLEEELEQMGMDMAGFDEQQALMESLQDRAQERDAGDEVVVLLNSLQGDLSFGSLQSVEVC